MEVGRSYMIQPITFDDKLVSTPYGIVHGSKVGRIRLRVANVGAQETTLEEKEPIATVEPKHGLGNKPQSWEGVR